MLLSRLIFCLVLAAAGVQLRAGAATQPSRMSLHLKDATLKQAVKELEKQVGASIPVIPPDLLEKNVFPRVSLDVKDAPFWELFKQFSLKTGLEPVVSGEDPYPRFQLGLGNGQYWKGAHAIGGPLIFLATDISRTSSIELGRTKHQSQRDLTLSLSAVAEPGLKLLSVASDVRLVEAEDDQAHSLMPGDAAERLKEPATFENPGGGTYLMNLTLELNCPEVHGPKIAKLKGRTFARIQTSGQRVEIEDVMKSRNVSRTVGSVPFTFKNLKKADIEYILQCSVRRSKAGAEEWSNLHQSIYNGMMSLYDAKGRLVAARATENGGEYTDNRIDANLRFVREVGVSDPDAGEPFKLVWDAPTKTQDLIVDFELMDIPIPE